MSPSEPPRSPLARLAASLALTRETVAVLVAVFCLELGEELWKEFFPDYLRNSLGASVLGVAVYSAARNLMEGLLFLGGASFTQRLGVRGSMAVATLVPLAGYFLLLGYGVPGLAVAGALAVSSFEALSVPSTFVVVGASVPKGKRTLAFAIQSIQKRLPKIVGPALAGLVVAASVRLGGERAGLRRGMLGLVGAGMALACVSLAVQWWLLARATPPRPPAPWRAAWRAMDPFLRRLLLSECLVRWCDWMVRDFAVLYVVSELARDRAEYGGLVALQMTVALATYIPVAFLADRGRERPLIGTTFVFFALFPLVLWGGWIVAGPAGLVLAYVVNGLREIGEPARKAIITTRFPEEVRAAGVGLYWGIRAFVLCPAPLVAAAIWTAASPGAVLVAAFGFGVAGTAIYAVTARRS
ncbi:MAG: hypothetical protein L0216_20235 [Planctomycetales bacterium]|nr:hypothetical protein [Planctomycetales bacterium]